MAKANPIRINSILGGFSPSFYQGNADQFQYSVAIDPNAYKLHKISGAITSIASTEFSGAALVGTPYWLMTNPKDSKIYAYCENGDLMSYSNVLGSETDIGNVTGGAGNGAAYYNNYLYLAVGNDVSRYGPLNNSPSLVNDFWNSTLGMTALTDTNYQGTLEYPNHPMHVHQDNRMYFGDVVDGQGVIHWIKTKKTSDEGDTDDGSTELALKLPFGYVPYAIQSWGEDLAILASHTGSDGTIYQGDSALFLWEIDAPDVYRKIEIPNGIATALKYVNGVLYVFHGSSSTAGGFRVSAFTGGKSLETIHDIPTGSPPHQGAVEAIGNRLYWAGSSFGNVDIPVVYAQGYTDSRLPKTALNCVAQISGGGAGAGFKVSAIKAVTQSVSNIPSILIGWGKGDNASAANNGLDRISATQGAGGGGKTAIWRSQVINVGQPFIIKKIRLTLGEILQANMAIVPTIYNEDGNNSTTLTSINNTNYPNSEKNVELYPDIAGEHNFFLELNFVGTATVPVVLPITIDIELLND